MIIKSTTALKYVLQTRLLTLCLAQRKVASALTVTKIINVKKILIQVS